MNKKILLAAFIKKEELTPFLEYLDKTFEIDSNKTFIFENVQDETQYILTFFIELELEEHINLRKHFKNALIVHKKKKCFYTINALNKLIESEYNLDKGNINYKEWDIDWSKYENKLIINSSNNLVLIDLKRFFC
tara:strand:+ start:30878 stop:31282 length:405 start_codon:yes stop_codon:yes gene_type:complete